MAHEITKHDHLVLTKERAWHNLGTVVQEAPTPEEALRLARLDWSPIISPLTATVQTTCGTLDEEGELITDETEVHIKSHRAIVRSDKPEIVLGVVGRKYVPVDNYTLADLCYTVTEQWRKETGNELKVESAGSLMEGRKVWFLLKADPFEVTPGDRVERYTLAFNGYDGQSALAFMPTTVRVVCNNTLTRAMRSGAGIRAKHTRNVESRVRDAMQALNSSALGLETQKEHALAMSKIHMDPSDRRVWWRNTFEALYPKPTTTGRNLGRWDKKRDDTLLDWKYIFEREVDTHRLQGTLWTTFNAVTNWLDHASPHRASTVSGLKAMDETERRIDSNLFGRVSKLKNQAQDLALQLI